MKKLGSIAKALLTLALSTAVLAACNNDRRNDNNGYYPQNGGIGLSGSCAQPYPQSGFGTYRGYGARPYSMNRVGGRQEMIVEGSDDIYNGYPRNSPGGYQHGFGGCGANEIAACGGYGQQQGGLMCVPYQPGFNTSSVYGYNYNNGAFGPGQPGGFGQCGTGGLCGQIAQTCVMGMTNGCMNGQCLPVNNSGLGVCAQQ